MTRVTVHQRARITRQADGELLKRVLKIEIGNHSDEDLVNPLPDDEQGIMNRKLKKDCRLNGATFR